MERLFVCGSEQKAVLHDKSSETVHAQFSLVNTLMIENDFIL